MLPEHQGYSVLSLLMVPSPPHPHPRPLPGQGEGTERKTASNTATHLIRPGEECTWSVAECASPSMPWLGARELPHQGLKARLHKMLVEGQGLVHPCFAHDHERNTVH